MHVVQRESGKSINRSLLLPLDMVKVRCILVSLLLNRLKTNCDSDGNNVSDHYRRNSNSCYMTRQDVLRPDKFYAKYRSLIDSSEKMSSVKLIIVKGS